MLQDASGVVFRAIDSETNELVAVRRFFPFGPGGGGLSVDEQAAYNIAIARLIGVTHPALCTVIGGGCDPVDGMPYIATEWLEGMPLKTYVDAKPLSPENATRLILEALDVSQLLSETLAEEVVWVETGLHTILVGDAATGRGFTFSISPLKGLGKHQRQRGLDGLVGLTEEVMGWRGIAVEEQAAGGLGAWLKWLRGVAKTTTLKEAREMLAASLSVEPPVTAQTIPIKRPMGQAPVLILQRKKTSDKFSLLPGVAALLLIGLGAAGLVYWHNLKHRIPNVDLAAGKVAITRPEPMAPASTAISPEKPAPTTAAEPVPEPNAVPGESPTEQATHKAAELNAAVHHNVTPQPASNQPSSLRADGVYTIVNGDLLLAQKGEVSFEGVLTGISYSRGGAVMYLLFSKKPTNVEPCGAINTKGASAGLEEAQIKTLIGKQIKVRGKVWNQAVRKLHRPVIVIESRAAITQQPE